MRVTQARRSNASQETRRARGAGASAGRFQLPDSRPVRSRAEAAMPAAVAGLGSIVALQAVEEPSERRRRAVETGDKILDLLEKLKIGLLSGGVSASDLDTLKRTIGRQLDLESDPELNDVLKQIDLRARVELAKVRGNTARRRQSRNF
ncbi:flagellar assembly protein FliX [bacterium BMS3Bbin10]|nr:flagellar assembly protein FliX [bacterium BMS3Bbin10]HDL16354.1 flagellar assembly regulator FliX [Hyphomicrobiales bacterium]